MRPGRRSAACCRTTVATAGEAGTAAAGGGRRRLLLRRCHSATAAAGEGTGCRSAPPADAHVNEKRLRLARRAVGDNVKRCRSCGAAAVRPRVQKSTQSLVSVAPGEFLWQGQAGGSTCAGRTGSLHKTMGLKQA